MLLNIEDISCKIATTSILRSCSLYVDEGEIVALLGRNGAGKSSTLKSILGLYPLNEGKIYFKNKDITNTNTRERVLSGIAFSPEDARLFPELTVEENIRMGFWVSQNTERMGNFNFDKAFHIFPALKNLINRRANTLSGGEKKMVAISRALALNPSLLLLDEALEGLAPLVVKSFTESIKSIKEDLGVSVILAESNIHNASLIVERSYIIERGEIHFEGSPQDILQSEELLALVGR